MRHWHHVIWIQHVVTDRLGLSIGDVLEHIWGRNVTQGPDAFGRGAAIVIDLDAAVFVHLYSCCF